MDLAKFSFVDGDHITPLPWEVGRGGLPFYKSGGKRQIKVSLLHQKSSGLEWLAKVYS